MFNDLKSLKTIPNANVSHYSSPSGHELLITKTTSAYRDLLLRIIKVF